MTHCPVHGAHIERGTRQPRPRDDRRRIYALVVCALAAVLLWTATVTVDQLIQAWQPSMVGVIEIVLLLSFTALVYLRERAHSKLVALHAELTKITEELRVNYERDRVLVETAVDGIITIDSQGIIETFNPASEVIFQYSAAEVLGKNVSMLMPEPQRSAHNGYLTRYLKSKETRVVGASREVVALRKNGETFPMSLALGSFEIGGQLHFCGIIRDISEQRNAQMEISRYTLDLERSNKALDDFAYIASHDLKEPVRGIYNHASLLARDFGDSLDEQIKHRVERITLLAQHAGRLIDDLLNYSRLGRAELSMQVTALLPIVLDAREVILASREEAITIEVCDQLPAIACDGPYIRELFLNLFSNGIKYNEQKHKVIKVGMQASTEPSGPPVFYVRDNGIGIHPRFHDEIFRIFKRLHKADAFGGGTGSGLTFVKKIVERHGGKIWIESTPGEGSTFYFTLSE